MVEFKINKSPFEFKRNYHAKSISKSFRLPEDVYNNIIVYFNEIYGENSAFTKGFNNLAIDKLNNLCRERKSYQDLNIVMLIPKTDDLEEINEKSEIIAFITIDDISNLNRDLLIMNEDEDENPNIKEPLEFYNLETYYNNIKHINPKCFKFNIDDVSSFDDFKNRLNDDYKNIDLDNSYLVQVDLNNYFDVYREGEFQSFHVNNYHLGVCAFVEHEGIDETRLLYCLIRWTYSSNILDINFKFLPFKNVMLNFKYDDKFDNEYINEALSRIENGGDRKKTLLKMREEFIDMRDNLNENIDEINNVLMQLYPEVFDD